MRKIYGIRAVTVNSLTVYTTNLRISNTPKLVRALERAEIGYIKTRNQRYLMIENTTIDPVNHLSFVQTIGPILKQHQLDKIEEKYWWVEQKTEILDFL